MATVFQPNRLASYDDNSILGEIRRVVTEHFQGKVPPQADFRRYLRVSTPLIAKRFGSWANAIKKAGFDYSGRNYESMNLKRERYHKDRMLADLKRVKGLNGGRYFSSSFYQSKGGKYSIKTLKKHFNSSWHTLLREQLSLVPAVRLRLKIRKGPKCPTKFKDDFLFLEMKRVWESLGHRPSYSDFKRLGQISPKPFVRRFGSWKKAIEDFFSRTEYGSSGSPNCRATPNLLVEELSRIAKSGKRTILTFDRYRKLGGKYSRGVFQRHFGSWKAALQSVGLHDGDYGRYSDEELFEEMQRLWEKYGRQPRREDMDRDGNFSAKPFEKRFGGWTQAVHAFCADRQSSTGWGPDAHQASMALAEELRKPESLAPTIQSKVAITGSKETIVVDSRRVPSLRLRFQVMQRDNFRCVICGRAPATHTGLVLQVDHKTPWARGGPTVIDNLQTLCKDCNSGKSDLLLE